ncbi:hypothetical protein INS49_004428 [Diaporthe citri]|uniref:uncharacterized protein n=1 Tax=Diaporthe citri TaxID=83186 RepID=UPI001C804FC8|nr:uncharacterized protein INS49_004428 [Diaporthe citri]KAG6354411.1 hypothetical protein INS49_004428 [Diaporthe citri]
MSTEVVVGIIALLIAALDTAIALWECISNHEQVVTQESHANGSSDTDDIRLSGQVVLPAISNIGSAEREALTYRKPS